jgi:hypothetical protein
VLITCQPSTVWCSRERLPVAAARPAKVRQSCSATDLFEAERERESQKGQYKSRSKDKTSGGKARGALYLRGKKSILEGTQAMPARPSDKDKMGVKMLGWWVVKA